MLQNQKLTGTNCYNCLYISKKEETVDASELNYQGGIDPKTEVDMKKAQKADLITLPEGSKADATNKKFCYHEQIGMFVTVRMCCAYWDNKGVIRPWKKNKSEARENSANPKEQIDTTFQNPVTDLQSA